MQSKLTIQKNHSRLLKILLVILCNVVTASFCYAQPDDDPPPDPGAMNVYTIQNIHFGAFSRASAGGTVIISNSGSRSVTGDIISLNMGVSYFNAIFEIDAPIGTMISILNGPDETLTGSNGGTMTMSIGASDPGSPFSTVVNQPTRTQVKIGGTLTVGTAAAAPPGTYSGNFYITFNQE